MSFKEWKSVQLGDVVDINTDAYSVKDNWHYVNYLDTGNITDGKIDNVQYIRLDSEELPSRAKRKIVKGDIIYSTVRPNQRHFGVIKNPLPNMLVSTGFAVIRGKTALAHTRFLYWFLTQQEVVEYLHAIGEHNTSTYPAIRPTDIESLVIGLPSIQEQKAIAEILSSLDDKIELNNRMNKTLEEIAQSLFKRWFVDFEFPDENGNPYKSSGGKMVESELGVIPEGWRVGSMDDIGSITGGGTPSKANPEYFTEFGIPWITPKDLSHNTNKYISHGATDITHEGYQNSSAKLMPAGTVLFSSRAPIGYLAIALNEVTTNQGFKSIVPNKGFESEYIYYLMKHIAPDIDNQATGSTFKEVSGGELKQYKIIIPKMNIILEFDDIVSALGKRQTKTESESVVLKQLRDTLLPKLMSGEIRVTITEE
jgi:type I restriction enzyme, S subunit